MSGSRQGGLRAAATNKAKYGKDYYELLGQKGGQAHNKGGFNDKQLARRAGIRGGRVSSRAPQDLKPSLAVRRERADFQQEFNQPGWSQKLFRRRK